MISSFLWGVSCVALGLLTAFFLRHTSTSSCIQENHHQNLNGLRGMTALTMFVSHASTWQQYLIDGTWRTPDNPVYAISGQTGIIIYFMLIGFIFTKEIISTTSTQGKWIQKYTALFLRITPAYILMLIGAFCLALTKTLQIHKNFQTCNLSDFLSWIAFTIPGAPELCQLKETNITVAGFTWPIAYEWTFYFSLPFIAIALKRKPSWATLATCGALFLLCATQIPKYSAVYISLGIGALSAIMDSHYPLQIVKKSSLASSIAVILLIANGFWHNTTSYTSPSIFIIGISFHAFGSGNSLNGLLHSKTLQLLGNFTYSLNLLHGLIIYIGLHAITSVSPDLSNNNILYWGFMLTLIPIWIYLAATAHTFIEYPLLKRSDDFASRLEKFISQLTSKVAIIKNIQP